MNTAHHFSSELSDFIGALLESGITMLRREDAYHIAVLTHGVDSSEASALATQRSDARASFRHFLDLVHSGMTSVES